jgi:hypothetical protein
MALPFTLKDILRQKKSYENSNISSCKNIIFKKSSKKNQNPSRYYIPITNLKFQHKPKSIKLLYSIMNPNTITLPQYARPINQSSQRKRGNTKNKMEGPMSKKTKESPKRENHKGNIKFQSPSSTLSLIEPSSTATASLKTETTCTRINTTDTLCLINVHKIGKGGLPVPFVPRTSSLVSLLLSLFWAAELQTDKMFHDFFSWVREELC